MLYFSIFNTTGMSYLKKMKRIILQLCIGSQSFVIS